MLGEQGYEAVHDDVHVDGGEIVRKGIKCIFCCSVVLFFRFPLEQGLKLKRNCTNDLFLSSF